MKPHASRYNPDPHYLRSLLAAAELSQEKAAALIRLSPRQLRYYLSTAPDHQDAPYTVQFALEALAGFPGQPEQRECQYAYMTVDGAFSISEDGLVWLSARDAASILGRPPIGTADECRTIAAWVAQHGGPWWLRAAPPKFSIRSDGAWCLSPHTQEGP